MTLWHYGVVYAGITIFMVLVICYMPNSKTIQLNESLGMSDSVSSEMSKKQQGNWGYGLRECKPFSPYNNMTDKFVRSLCNV